MVVNITLHQQTFHSTDLIAHRFLSPVCLRHHVHALHSVPGAVRISGEDALVAGSVPAAVGERQLNHARLRAGVNTHLVEKEDFIKEGRQ